MPYVAAHPCAAFGATAQTSCLRPLTRSGALPPPPLEKEGKSVCTPAPPRPRTEEIKPSAKTGICFSLPFGRRDACTPPLREGSTMLHGDRPGAARRCALKSVTQAGVGVHGKNNNITLQPRRNQYCKAAL